MTDSCVIMGIVNVTPDSFSDGGLFFEPERAIDHALKLLSEGADYLDIGAESTRPNSDVLSVADEQKRLRPVLEKIIPMAHRHGKKISVDTRNASTMAMALEMGVDMINDVSALTHDPQAIHILKHRSCHVCLMHMKGTPQTMQNNPTYQNATREILQFLQERVEACQRQGIDASRLMVDVGIGFGKTLDHNLELLKNMDQFLSLGFPVLCAVSRKSFLEKIHIRQGGRSLPIADRLSGSLAVALYAYQKGVRHFRVHDVKPTKLALEAYAALDNTLLPLE
jgi:dihydropteroate synthase